MTSDRRRSAHSTTCGSPSGRARGRRPARRGMAPHRGEPSLQPPAVGRGGPGAAHRRSRRVDRREQARDRRLQSEAQRRDRAHRRDAARAPCRRRAGCRRMAQLGDGRRDDRPPVDPRAQGPSHAGADAAQRRIARARRELRGEARAPRRCSARTSRAASTRCSRAPRKGRAFWRIYRQFKMYNDPALNPWLYRKPS